MKTNVHYQELDCEPKELKNNSDIIQSKISSGIVIISCVQENKVSIVTSVSKRSA